MRIDRINNNIDVRDIYRKQDAIADVNRDSVNSSEDSIRELSDTIDIKADNSILNNSLICKNVQEEVSKLQIAYIYLGKENKVLIKLNEDMDEANNDSIDMNITKINDKISKVKDEIISISDKACFDNINLFEQGEEYVNGRFRVPSMNLGGKNYLPFQNLDISTKADIGYAITIIQSAIYKIDQEMSLCKDSIDFFSSEYEMNTKFASNEYVDAEIMKKRMKSLKNQIFNESQRCIQSQRSSIASIKAVTK